MAVAEHFDDFVACLLDDLLSPIYQNLQWEFDEQSVGGFIL